jgi:hypothetical protein
MFDEKAAASGAVPEPPGIFGGLAPLPESVKKQWREVYAKAFSQAKLDSPNEPTVHAQRARKTANRLLEVEKPTSYAEAMAMPDWQVFKRERRNGQLVLVTIEARGADAGESKFFFDVPAEPVDAANDAKTSKSADADKDADKTKSAGAGKP